MSANRKSNNVSGHQILWDVVERMSLPPAAKRQMQFNGYSGAGIPANTNSQLSSATAILFPRFDPKKALRAKVLVAKAGVLVLNSLPGRLSEEYLAAALNIEVQELHSVFHQVCGVRMHTALRMLRTDEVKRRLDADVRLPIETAMRQCGFGSYATFGKDFQRKFGVDPRVLRKVRRAILKAVILGVASNEKGQKGDIIGAP